MYLSLFFTVSIKLSSSACYMSLWTRRSKHQFNETLNSKNTIFINLSVYCSFRVNRMFVFVWCHWVFLIIVINAPIKVQNLPRFILLSQFLLNLWIQLSYFTAFSTLFLILLWFVIVNRTRDMEVSKILALINCMTLSTLHNVSETQSLFQ